MADRVARLADVESRWEAKRLQLADELERVEKLLATAYDRSVKGPCIMATHHIHPVEHGQLYINYIHDLEVKKAY